MIISVGGLLLGSCIFLAVMALPSIIRPNDALISRVVVLEAGFLPYLLSVVVYHYVYNPQELGLWSLYVGGGVLCLFIVAVLSSRLQAWLKWPSAHTSNNPSWAYTWFIAASGILVIILELAVFQ